MAPTLAVRHAVGRAEETGRRRGSPGCTQVCAGDGTRLAWPAVTAVGDQLRTMAPALAFLLAGVPLAALLERLGFFDAVVSSIAARVGSVSVLILWVLAAVTTVVLNLDTTVVLLTPLYLRLARRAGADPVAVALVPLLLASLASSVLPVSNLTTLIAAQQFHLGVAQVARHLALPSLAASTAGWLVYRRRHPTTLACPPGPPPDRRALRIGGAVVAGVLVGFTVGGALGVPAWSVALVADAILVAVTRWLPWRTLPVTTAAGVAVVAAAVALVIPSGWLVGLLSHDRPLALVGIVGLAGAAANLVNNLPALLVALDGAHQMTWGMWAWLLGVNTAAVLLPLGALANLLWRRVLADDEVAVSWADYVRLTVPVAVPAVVAAAAVLALEHLVAG
jgi:arsenical pump membrane protein